MILNLRVVWGRVTRTPLTSRCAPANRIRASLPSCQGRHFAISTEHIGRAMATFLVVKPRFQAPFFRAQACRIRVPLIKSIRPIPTVCVVPSMSTFVQATRSSCATCPVKLGLETAMFQLLTPFDSNTTGAFEALFGLLMEDVPPGVFLPGRKRSDASHAVFLFASFLRVFGYDRAAHPSQGSGFCRAGPGPHLIH